MIPTRKLGKLLRGKATPFQVMAACVLGSWIGFVPGFAQAPGWLATLVVLMLVLNANLGIAILVGGLAKLASLALISVTFDVGQFLLDGPTRGVFQAAANAPVLAWFGFEYYVTTGGILMGLVFGLCAGLIVTRTLGGFRRKLADLERDSARYQAFVAKPWAKLLCFVFVGGGHGKQTYAELMERRVGNPVRIAGVVVVALFAAGGFFLRGLLADPLITEAVRTELARANGATVDVGGVTLDLAGGRLVIEDLALADPDRLDTDIFRADRLEADLDVGDLLRKRFTIELLLVSGAMHGAPRATPGELLEPETEPPPPAVDAPREDEKTLDDYLADAKVWKERLAQAQDIIERVWGGESDDDQAAEEGESTRDRLERLARELGYANVVSEELLADVPTLTIGELIVEGLSSTGLEGEVLDLHARNLSTQPHLNEARPEIDLRSRSGSFVLALGVDASGTTPEPNGVHFRWDGTPVDRLASSLTVKGQPLLSGGTLDLSLDGAWAGAVGFVDFPLMVTLHDTSIHVPGHGSELVEELPLEIGLRGPLDALRIRIDASQLQDALVRAGAARLAGELEDKLDKVVEDEQAKLREKAEQEAQKAFGNKLKGRFGGLLGGDG